MLFKKLEWGLEDNQVHINYYIVNKNNDNYNMILLIHFFNDSEYSLYFRHYTRVCKYRGKQDKVGIVQIELGLY